MKLKNQITRFCKARSYKKAKRNEKINTTFDSHTNAKIIEATYGITNDTKNHIVLYGNIYGLNKSDYRIVNRTTYQGKFAYKVYDKIFCRYKIYSPFFNKMIEA